MLSLQPIRGMHDLLPEQNRIQDYIIKNACEIGELYGYQTMSTPILEFTEVFQRTLGTSSDILMKEMYSFQDRNGTHITLRPEGTAGIARAYPSNGLYNNQSPIKINYHGPMFRYERPQKGRTRQFYQIGAELLGIKEVIADIEIIAYCTQLIKTLGLWDNITLQINTLGTAQNRASYRDILLNYFKSHIKALSEESRLRITRNPLRIFDSKKEEDYHIINNAPFLEEYLDNQSKSFFKELIEGLNNLDINYEINPRLVRGLDYYCHTCFEFKTNLLGTQDTIIGGGRYDGLTASMGGPNSAGVGWAGGVERLSLMIDKTKIPKPKRMIVVIPHSIIAQKKCLILTHNLRTIGIATELYYTGSLKKRLKKANKIDAKLVVILGDIEISDNIAQLRDLDSGIQDTIPFDQLIDIICKKLNKKI